MPTKNSASMSMMLLIGSIPIVLIGVVWLIKVCLFISSAEEAKGKIVGFETTPGRTGVTLPRYEFADKQGKTHRVVSSSTSASDHFVEGSDVTVKYDPRNPDHSSLGGFAHLFLFPVTLMVVGGIGVAGSVLLHFLERLKG